MKVTTESIPAQNGEGIWTGGELYLAHVDLEADDLAQIPTLEPFLELLPSPGFRRALIVLSVTGEWLPGRVFESPQSLIMVYGNEIGDVTASIGPVSQPLQIDDGIDFPVVIPMAYTFPLTGSAVYAPSDSVDDKPICMVAGQRFAELGAVTGYHVENDDAGSGYSVDDEIDTGVDGEGETFAKIIVDSVDEDGAVLTSHLLTGGDPLYGVGQSLSDVHAGEEGHPGVGFTAVVDSTDAPPVEGALHLEILYRVVALHTPVGIG